MATTYPLPTLAPVITDAGVVTYSYSDILTSLQTSFRQIYGADAYLEPDSQDGQLLAVFALAIYDCGQSVVAAYNSFSPATAFGEGLSRVVKINHLARLIATKSQVNVTVGGTTGTVITNGIVGDADGHRWLLPSSVTIPLSGTITVTAMAEVDGAVSAPISTITLILTPTAGWQTVTNGATATVGQPVESDGELRTRQELSPAINSYTVLSGITAVIKALPGVTYGVLYENDTGTTDANGVPGHTIALVVKGGDAADIAQTIYERKAPGVGTYGSTTVNITDIAGSVRPINFTVPYEILIQVAITVTADVGYTSNIGAEIKAAIVNHINALDIGEDVIINRLYVPALLNGKPHSETYKITVVQACWASGGTLGTTDLPMSFIQKAVCALANVTVTVV